MWGKNASFPVPDVTSLGYFYSCLIFLIGAFFISNGYVLYAGLAKYGPIIGSEFYKIGFGTGVLGLSWMVLAIYGMLALNQRSCRYIIFYAAMSLSLGFSTALISITSYYFGKVPEVTTNPYNIVVYKRMYDHFMDNEFSPIMNDMEKEFDCCGIDSIEDYFNRTNNSDIALNTFVPLSCFPSSTCGPKIFKNVANGCFEKVSSFINRNIFDVAILGIFINILSASGAYSLYTISLFIRQNLL